MSKYQVTGKRGRSVWFWIGMAVIVLVLLCSLGLNMLLGILLVGGAFVGPDAGVDPVHVFRERFVSGSGRDKVLLIPLEGIISSCSSRGLWGRNDTVSEIRTRFRKASGDKNIRAILLVIDSPGGEITASDIIHEEIVKMRKSGRKVVAELGDVAASGGYYCAAPCDFILAHPTTITGSVGVIIRSANIEGLFEKFGIQDVTIKSGPEKDILSPTRPMTEKEREILQTIIDEMLDRFLQVVAEGRGLDAAELEEIASGNIYTGEQALSLKLVDAIGYREDAIEKVKQLLGLIELKVVRYERVYTLKDILRIYSMRMQSGGGIFSSLGEALDDGGTRFLYLWKP